MDTRYKRHAGLVDRMANARGVDLEEEMLRGRLGFMQLEDAVLKCTGCTAPCACEKWLEDLSGPATETPAFCRNDDLFRRLQRD